MTPRGRVRTVLCMTMLAALAAGVIGCGSGDATTKAEDKAFNSHPDAKGIAPPPADAGKVPPSNVPPHAMSVDGNPPPPPPPQAMHSGAAGSTGK